MKLSRFFVLSFTALTVFIIGNHSVKSNIVDDECESDDTTVENEITNSIDKQISSVSKSERKNAKKSLVIVFDGTNSMKEDLDQMRDAAKEIITELSEVKDKPIKNYVLTVFKDPTILPTLDTEDHIKLFHSLDNIKLGDFGNIDCPEKALGGLLQSINHALYNSLVYVFTDDMAKDFELYDQVLPIIQKKQLTVNFLITKGACGSLDREKIGFLVYEKIASVSEGQVFDLSKNSIKDAIIALRKSLDTKYETLASLNFQKAGNSKSKLSVDKSFSQLSVSLAGLNSKLSIKDNKNEEIESKGFSSNNVKFMTFDVKDSVYTIEAAADSAYSIRVGGLSELKFEFGFSTKSPSERAETSIRPLIKHQNVLSIFISDASLVKCLTMAIILPVIPTKSFDELKVPLKRVNRDMFSSPLFDVPTEMFKIKISGYDNKGSKIERLISSGIESVKGFLPEVEIISNSLLVNQYSELVMTCKITSLTPATTVWMFENEIRNTKTSNQSSSSVMIVKKFDVYDVGNYSCRGWNSLGEVVKSVSIIIKLAPIVEVIPHVLKLSEGSTGSLRCNVKGADSGYTISWKDGLSLKKENNKEIYEFTANKIHHNQNISCEVQSGDFLESSSCFLSVEFAPDFIKSTNDSIKERKINHRANFTLHCDSIENPSASVTLWYFNGSPLENKMRSLSFARMNSSIQGMYKCIVTNSVGFAIKNFRVTHTPAGPPKIQAVEKIAVTEGENVVLSCSCKICLPIKISNWKHKNKKCKHKISVNSDEKHDNFITKMIIKNISSDDEGLYECEISNSFKKIGIQKRRIEVSVKRKPGDIKVILKGEKLIIVDKIVEIKSFYDFTLECFVTANPVPVIQWFKNDKKIGDYMINFSKTQMHNHDGYYKCTVENDVGMISKTFQLKVKIAPFTNSNQDQFLAVKTAEKASLGCDISGSPEPVIKWFINLKPLTNSNVYKLTKGNKVLEFVAQTNLVGEYSCMGANEFGNISIDFDLQVLGPPFFFNPSNENIKKKIGEHLQLKCDAMGYPYPKVSWYKGEKKIEENKSLFLFKIGIVDAGAYTCYAENSEKKVKKTWNVSVYKIPKLISLPKNITIKLEPKTVKCNADGHPKPEVSWFLKSEKIHSGLELLISPKMKSGYYTCKAKNAEGKDEHSFYVDVRSAPVMLPNFNHTVTVLNVTDGENIEILCPFKNFDKLTWKLNGFPINETNAESLKLKKIDSSSEGKYTCFVSNEIGASSFSYEILILKAPSIKVEDSETLKVSLKSKHEEKILVKLGETLTLNCKAYGYPKPTLYWTKAGEIFFKEETLRIGNFSSNDEGTYVCSVRNSQGIATRTYNIEISSAPFVRNTIKTQKIEKPFGETVNLYCKIDGTPKPEISWKKDGILINGLNKNQLEIKNLSLRNVGIYECIGSSSEGTASVEFNVLLKQKAEIVKFGNIENESKPNIISCIFRGQPLPTVVLMDSRTVFLSTKGIKTEEILTRSSIIYFNEYGREIKQANSQKLSRLKRYYSRLAMVDDGAVKLDVIFNDRSSASTGFYVCKVQNVHGSVTKEFEKKTMQVPRFTDGISQEVYQTVEFNEAIELNCILEGFPEPTVQWMFNGKIITGETAGFIVSNDQMTLKIKNCNNIHKNGLQCRGENNLGMIIRYFNLNVKKTPRWSEFSDWSPCSVTCGKGFQDRSRECRYPDGRKIPYQLQCSGSETEKRPCDQPECLGWTEWKHWSPCSTTCGVGYQVRRRSCNDNFLLSCEGESIEYKYCQNDPCRMPKH